VPLLFPSIDYHTIFNNARDEGLLKKISLRCHPVGIKGSLLDHLISASVLLKRSKAGTQYLWMT
jgi:hypothetical protein